MTNKKKNNRYNINKAASIGEEIVCPSCGKHFIKKSYQQAFCQKECKDRYWNNKRKNNGYFRTYNIEHPERLERIGIDLDSMGYDPDICLGDPEWESLAQITLDPECYDEVEW